MHEQPATNKTASVAELMQPSYFTFFREDDLF